MGESTAISWTDHTFNPWWGCVKVSPACDGCYAERDAHRYGFADGGGNGPELWGRHADRRGLSDAHWAKPLAWDRAAAEAGRPALVFCASMADVFEARDDLDPLRDRLWELIEATPHLIWQLLTKRPEQVLRRVPHRWLQAFPQTGFGWPANVWVGTTVENQHYADLRVPRLLEVPAPVRFLSCEPLLGPVDVDLTGIDWVIVGGESGPDARPMHPDWARALRDQVHIDEHPCSGPCLGCGAGVDEACTPPCRCDEDVDCDAARRALAQRSAFFFKQWGEWAPIEDDEVRYGEFHHGPDLGWVESCMCSGGHKPVLYRVGRKRGGDELDGRRWQEFPAGVVR